MSDTTSVRRGAEEWETESVAGYEGRFASLGAKMVGDMLAEVRDDDGKVGGWVRGQAVGYDQGETENSLSDDEVPFGEEVVDGGGLRAAEVVARAVRMREVSSEWQAGVQARTYTMLGRGRFPGGSPDRREECDQLLFKSKRVISLPDMESIDGLVEEIKAGVVVATVVAPTGSGKSTRLSAAIANKASCRVLQISPDVDLKTRHGNAIRERTVVSKYWTAEKGPRVCLMTPQEFCGRFFGDGWDEMLQMFDVVVLDEAHIPLKYFYGVKEAVSTKGNGRLSLLMLSATAVGQVDMQSSRGAPLFVPRLLEEIVSDEGFVDGDFCVDGTQFIVESDERVNRVVEMLSGIGCKVYSLESGSSSAAIDRVSEAMKGDSAAVRLLVTHGRFGTGANLPVTRVVTTGMRQVIVADGKGGFETKSVPLSIPEIKQHLARAGRDIVTGHHRGVVLLDQRTIPQQEVLLESERFGAYVLLKAMGIVPCAQLQKAVGDVLPFGLTRRMAVAIMNVVAFPPEVTVRFLASDGRFPSAYAWALRGFSAQTGGVLATDDEEVMHGDLWTEVPAFSVLGEEVGPKIKVPFVASGELGAIVTLVCASAQRLFQMKRVDGRPDDGYASGPEQAAPVIKGKWKTLPYRPAPLEMVPVREVQETEERSGFVLDVESSVQPRYRRRGYSQFPVGVSDALRLDAKGPRVEEYVDPKGRSWVQVFSEDDEASPVVLEGEVGSGGKAFRVPSRLWTEMIAGRPLFGTNLRLFMMVLSADGGSFASGAAFSNWNNCWLSVLKTFCEPENVELIQKKAAMELVVVFISRLWQRYVLGMKQAVDVSHWSVGPWQKWVKRFRGDSPMMSSGGSSGKLDGVVADVVQSRSFLQRLYDIRLHFSMSLNVMEDQGFFSPQAVSELQRVLPISVGVGDKVHDAVRRGKASARDKKGMYGRHTRGDSAGVVLDTSSFGSEGSGYLVDVSGHRKRRSGGSSAGEIDFEKLRDRFVRK